MRFLNGNFAFVVFEGIDGTGKTCVAKAMAQLIGGQYFYTPEPQLANAVVQDAGRQTSLRCYIEEMGDVETRFLYYMMATAHASVQIARMLQTQHVVCDHYLFCTLAYHRALGSTLASIPAESPFIRPDITFLLQVESSERNRRMNGRMAGHTTNQPGWYDDDALLLRRVEKEFAGFNVRPIETTGLTADEVTYRCLEHLPILKEAA